MPNASSKASSGRDGQVVTSSRVVVNGGLEKGGLGIRLIRLITRRLIRLMDLMDLMDLMILRVLTVPKIFVSRLRYY